MIRTNSPESHDTLPTKICLGKESFINNKITREAEKKIKKEITARCTHHTAPDPANKPGHVRSKRATTRVCLYKDNISKLWNA